jgi:hypothetical protein
MKPGKNDITNKRGHLHSIIGANDLNAGKTKKKAEYKQENEEKEILRRLRIQNIKLQEQLTSLKKKLKQTISDKTKFKEMMDQTRELEFKLSEALGSCQYCWGNDPGCLQCSGNGISGWRKINKRLFNVYVLPALDKFYGLGKKIR